MKKTDNVQNPIDKRHREDGVKFYHSVLFYFPWLIKEMLLSSLEVAKLVFTPKKIDPKIVSVETRIKSKAGKVIYANSITLTPGTFTIDIEKDSLLVHYLAAKDVGGDQMEKKVRGILC